MRLASVICLVIFIVSLLISLAQLWFTPFEWALFTKVLITMGTIFVITLAIGLVHREYIQDKKLKDNNYID